MKRVASLACALSVLAAAHAGAQQADPDYSAEAVRSVFAAPATAPLPGGALTPLLAAAPVVDAPVVAPVDAAAPSARQGVHSATRSFLHTLGGAVVGAWLGLVTSQVLKSDWDKESNQEVVGHRAGFALGGAVFGGAGGLFIGSRASSDLAAGLRQARREDQEIITLEQIQAASAGNVYELVQSLHPEWLRGRGTNSFTEGAKVEGGEQGTFITPGLPTILVYQDNARLGDVEALRAVPTAEAGSVQFLNPAQATYRYGIGHAHGVILITTRR